MKTARDDRAGKFLCHGLRRLVSGGGCDLIDVNAVESALNGEGARGDLRRDDRFFVRKRELCVARAAVADRADRFSDAVDPGDRDNALRARRNARLMRVLRLARPAL